MTRNYTLEFAPESTRWSRPRRPRRRGSTGSPPGRFRLSTYGGSASEQDTGKVMPNYCWDSQRTAGVAARRKEDRRVNGEVGRGGERVAPAGRRPRAAGACPRISPAGSGRPAV